MKFQVYFGLILIFVLFGGCVEIEEEEKGGVRTTTSIPVEETSTIMETTTTLASTTSIILNITSTTTTISKINFSCDDFCKKEGYEGGICRKTPAQCKIYGINEIYKPLGNRYCPKGTGYDTCCCKFSTPTTITTTTVLEEENKTTEEEVKGNKASGFEKIRPIDTTIKYQSDGLISFKILNLIGDIKIVNISSENCLGVGIGSLDKSQLSFGEDTMFRAWCDEKTEGEKFDIDLKFTYKELVNEILEVYEEDDGVIAGIVEK